MQENGLQTKLLEYGLHEREVLVLLEIAKLGKATAVALSRALKQIPRTSMYDIATSLVGKGFVTTVTEQNQVYYQAQGVEHVIDVLESKKREIEDKQNQLRNIADTFQQLKNGSVYEPHVRFFEGKGGVMAIHREFQNARKSAMTIVDIESVAKFFPSMIFEDNLKDFQTHGVFKRDLMVPSKKAVSYLRSAPISEFHKVKWLPKEVVFQSDTLIWEGHVAIIDYANVLSGVILDNPTIQKTFSAWFEMMWGSIPNEVRKNEL